MSFIKENKLNFCLIIILFVCLILMNFHQGMSPYWVGPYLSAAANFDMSFKMNVNFDDIKQFSQLSKDIQFAYKFPSNSNVIEYNYLAKGFLFILLFAKKIFFYLGDLEAVQYLQYLVHISITLSIFNIMDKKYKRILFFIFYGINPIILYFANYPFYYFWQIIPSYILIYYYLSNKIINNKIFIVTFVFIFIYMTRPTVLFLIIFFYFLYGYKENWQKALVAIMIFLGFSFGIKSNSIGPWHTMYVGLGAYSNSYNIKLADEDGYKLFYKKTGKIMNSTNVIKQQLHEEYYGVVKKEYLKIVADDVGMIVRNAILNILESYSVGYKVGNNFNINYVSIAVGIIMMLLLLYTKQYILFLAIGFAGGSFTPYFPPIGAYMYGSYILIVVGFIGIIEFFISKKGMRIHYAYVSNYIKK